MRLLHSAAQLPAALHSSTRAVQPAAAVLPSQSVLRSKLCNRHTNHAQHYRSLVSCKAAKQQQQQQQSQRDRPDMGRRSSRRVRLPTPEEMLNLENGSQTPDPESQGFQERATLMAFLENLEPEMRDQFSQYMDMQVQRMEQQQDVTHATDYMQRVIDKAGDRAGISADNFDADAYVNSREGKDIMWQSLREQFSPEEQSLLDDVLGRDWQSFGQRGLTPEAVAKISSLSEEQGAMLTNMLARMEQMDKSMDVLVKRSADDGKPSSSSSSGSSSSRPSSSSSSWGSSFRKKKSARVRSKATEAADQYWDKFLNGQMTDKVQRMMFYASQASKGQLTWGRPPAQHFITLKQIYTEMVQLEGVQRHEPGKLSSDDVAAAYARINYTLNQLVSQLDSSSGDTATRSALLYMDALFNSSSSSYGQQPGGGSTSDQQLGSSSGSDQQPGGSSNSSEHQQQGAVGLSKLQQLGRFLKAAENLDAFQTWLSVFAEKHPGVTSPDMIMLSNLGGDDWFLKPQQQEEALAAAQAAATAWQQQAGEGSSSSSGSSVQAAISGALLPYVDEGRIEALATLDAATLWFLTELEANNHSEDVLLKWSLHPEISQKLMQGNWFDESEMSESIRKLYHQAQVPGFMAGLNFDLQQSSE